MGALAESIAADPTTTSAPRALLRVSTRQDNLKRGMSVLGVARTMKAMRLVIA